MLCSSTCFNQRSSSVDIFISSNYSKKVAAPKSNFPKELSILTKWLLSRSFVPRKLGIQKNNCCEETTLSRTELLKKKQLLWRNRCSERVTVVSKVEVVKEVWRSSFSENKAVRKKSLNMSEGKSSFEKKKKRKSQIKLVITFNWNYSPRKVPSPW